VAILSHHKIYVTPIFFLIKTNIPSKAYPVPIRPIYKNRSQGIFLVITPSAACGNLIPANAKRSLTCRNERLPVYGWKFCEAVATLLSENALAGHSARIVGSDLSNSEINKQALSAFSICAGLGCEEGASLPPFALTGILNQQAPCHLYQQKK